MAIPFALPTEDDADPQGEQLEQLMLDLHVALQHVLRTRHVRNSSRNHRLPRRSADALGSREHSPILVVSDLSRLPLPDLVLSAVEQLPSAEPLVTVSAPSSPTRDVAFQFPECSGEPDNSMPIPSPRPRPRLRRLGSESTVMMKKGPFESTSSGGNRRMNHQARNEEQWANVGANLRNIADDFHASKSKDTVIEKSRLPAINPGFLGSGSSSSEGLLSYIIPAHIRETLWTTVALYLGWRLVSRLR